MVLPLSILAYTINASSAMLKIIYKNKNTTLPKINTTIVKLGSDAHKH